ncbi:MAG: recombination mediator protein UvsY [Nanoarchaeota archaeon]
MNLEEFKALRNEVVNSVKIDEDKIDHIITKIPLLHSKYLRLYSTEFHKLKLLQIKIDKLYGDLYHYYRYEYDYSMDKKYEIETYINKDERYIKLRKGFAFQDTVVKFLENTIKTIKELNYTIKNYIDWKKLLAGE